MNVKLSLNKKKNHHSLIKAQGPVTIIVREGPNPIIYIEYTIQ